MTVDIEKLANELEGTCGSLDDALQRQGLTIDEVPTEVMLELDNLVMECGSCGWWCEASEVDEDANCRDCQ